MQLMCFFHNDFMVSYIYIHIYIFFNAVLLVCVCLYSEYTGKMLSSMWPGVVIDCLIYLWSSVRSFTRILLCSFFLQW